MEDIWGSVACPLRPPGSPGVLWFPYTVPSEPGSRACISQVSTQTRPFDSIWEASALTKSGLVEGTAQRAVPASKFRKRKQRQVCWGELSGQAALGQACGYGQHPSWSCFESTESLPTRAVL